MTGRAARVAAVTRAAVAAWAILLRVAVRLARGTCAAMAEALAADDEEARP